MTQTSSISIIGAGLVGSLLALGLAKKGYRVHVFESRPDLRKNDISAGKSINLALANRGIRALEQQGIFDQVKPLLIEMKGRMVHLTDQQAQFQTYGINEHEVIYSISRGGLNALLLDEAEKLPNVTLNFNHRVTGVDLDNKQLSFKDEQQQNHLFDRVIGTDGANSVLREAIAEHSQTPTQVTIDTLSHGYKELAILPDSNGKHQIEVNALHIWPRQDFMLIALPNLDGSFTLTLFLAKTGETSFEQLTSNEQIMTFFKQQFPDVYPLIDSLARDFNENPTGNLATVRCQQWHYQDIALLLGDAAHAIVPFHGQGMNCGFEDCYDLLNQIPPAGAESNWLEIFSNTQTLRKPNANAIADMALENYIEMRASVAEPTFLRQKEIARQLQSWFPEHFTPRYAMVMFGELPYAQAQRIGETHKALLRKIDDWQQQGNTLTQADGQRFLREFGLMS
ncbi:FAD-dependent monooxygenase [Thalassotalea sp. LPB0316]|uniref:FAD-dependent oxidoreductase n=1 Tax=Thalassotalea sp. LPB0316 TaxID=2769490 RepID=UPI001866F9E0|nr:NAD(P)/FAD-dependent oxidoreductase [Thalassotalea sp. LPB0316]QOL24488.1 FAD-dependent monooxygenase [Thalassotalea sp. LPB0316]